MVYHGELNGSGSSGSSGSSTAAVQGADGEGALRNVAALPLGELELGRASSSLSAPGHSGTFGPGRTLSQGLGSPTFGSSLLGGGGGAGGGLGLGLLGGSEEPPRALVRAVFCEPVREALHPFVPYGIVDCLLLHGFECLRLDSCSVPCKSDSQVRFTHALPLCCKRTA